MASARYDEGIIDPFRPRLSARNARQRGASDVWQRRGEQPGCAPETATVATVVSILARPFTHTLVKNEVSLELQTILWN